MMTLDSVVKAEREERFRIRREAKKQYGAEFVSVAFRPDATITPIAGGISLVIPYKVILTTGFQADQVYSIAL
jgi:hypothetical protein